MATTQRVLQHLQKTGAFDKIRSEIAASLDEQACEPLAILFNEIGST